MTVLIFFIAAFAGLCLFGFAAAAILGYFACKADEHVWVTRERTYCDRWTCRAVKEDR